MVDPNVETKFHVRLLITLLNSFETFHVHFSYNMISLFFI
jgi:hypothetical protein